MREGNAHGQGGGREMEKRERERDPRVEEAEA